VGQIISYKPRSLPLRKRRGDHSQIQLHTEYSLTRIHSNQLSKFTREKMYETIKTIASTKIKPDRLIFSPLFLFVFLLFLTLYWESNHLILLTLIVLNDFTKLFFYQVFCNQNCLRRAKGEMFLQNYLKLFNSCAHPAKCKSCHRPRDTFTFHTSKNPKLINTTTLFINP